MNTQKGKFSRPPVVPGTNLFTDSIPKGVRIREQKWCLSLEQHRAKW